MIFRWLLASICLGVLPCTNDVIAVPNHLALPMVYDDAGELSSDYGQIFTSEANLVSGVRWYIGDPTRPGQENVDALEGAADLVLYDAADVNNPIELARTQVQGPAGFSEGLSTFEFDTPIVVMVGHSYFIGLDTDDLYGLGLRAHTMSTYDGGYEARLRAGILEPAGGGGTNPITAMRDTSFEILNDSLIIPEPSSLVSCCFGIAAMVLCGRHRRISDR